MLAGHFPIYDHGIVASFVDFMQKFFATKNHFLCVGFSQNADRRLAIRQPHRKVIPHRTWLMS